MFLDLPQGDFYTISRIIPHPAIQASWIIVTMPAQRIFVIALAIPLALNLPGCGRSRATLVEIRQFSNLALQASQQFPAIAEDFYDSCVRRAQYRYPVALAATGGATVTTAFADHQKALRECDHWVAPLRDNLIQTHTVLSRYVVVLSQLASPETGRFDGIDVLQASLATHAAPPLSQIGRASVGDRNLLGLVQTILQGAGDRSRASVLREVVVRTDDAFQRMVVDFASIIQEQGYLATLTSEEAALDDYYRLYLEQVIRDREQGDRRTSTVNLVAIEAEWRAHRATLTERRALAARYVRFMESVAADHHQLRVSFQDGIPLPPDDLTEQVHRHTTELHTLLHDMHRNIRSTGDGTRSEADGPAVRPVERPVTATGPNHPGFCPHPAEPTARGHCLQAENSLDSGPVRGHP